MRDVAASARLLPAVVPGPAGSLEALLRLPEAPKGSAVIAHPHPLHGGTMHTKVVHRAAKILADRFSLAALRFNFRGVGASQGTYDEGRGEVDDVRAACSWVRERYPEGPFVLGGFSFGSVAALKAAASVSPDLLFLMGIPLDRFDPASVPLPAGLPVVWIQGERDGFGSGERAREAAGKAGFSLATVAEADHFFAGRLDAFEEAATARLSEAFAGTGVSR